MKPRDDPKFEAWDDEDSLIENLIEAYLMKKDSAACYDIESKIFNFRQGTLSITYTKDWRCVKLILLHTLGSLKRGESLSKEKLPSLSESEETQRLIMLDKETPTQDLIKVPQKDQPMKENPSQRVVVENIAHIANDQDISRISATNFMERRMFLNE
ncbi:hypothetical protein CR513_58587, partial [Mucuna pruriens]